MIRSHTVPRRYESVQKMFNHISIWLQLKLGDILQELNLDLVQFPKPVYINQVRVIPLGAKVQADFPGGVRLG